MEFIFSLEEIDAIAGKFWQEMPGQQVFALHGKMGAGKTTLVKALCAAKGVQDNTGSPTFSIINEYIFKDDNGKDQSLFHLDLYRLRNFQEAMDAGVEDTLYSGSICFVEWPDVVEELLPSETIHLYLEALPDQKRRLKAATNSVSLKNM